MIELKNMMIRDKLIIFFRCLTILNKYGMIWPFLGGFMETTTISFEDVRELESFASDEDIKKTLNYVNRYFSKSELSNNQFENCIRLSSFLKKNNITIGDIEAEKLLENSKINNMLKSLELAGILIRVGQFFNLSSLLEMYCIKNNIVLTRDSEISMYDIEDNDIDLIKLYLNEIGEFKVLDIEEEKELIRRMNLGDQKAREKIASHNLRLVVSIAKNYSGYGVDLGDLIQFGNEGLLIAMNKFDINKGYKFSTYATYWIRQAVSRGIAVTSRNIRIPVYIHEHIIKLRRAINFHILVNNGRIPSNKELSEITGIPLDKVELAMECMNTTISLSTPSGGGEEKDSTLEETILDDSIDMDSNANRYYIEKILSKLEDIASLNEREKFVIRARYGFYGKIYSLEEIGKKYGCSREWVRQIEDRSLDRLRLAARVKDTYDMYHNYIKKYNDSPKLEFRYNI